MQTPAIDRQSFGSRFAPACCWKSGAFPLLAAVAQAALLPEVGARNRIPAFIISRGLFDLLHRLVNQAGDGIHDRTRVVSKLLRRNYVILEVLKIGNCIISKLAD